MHKEIMKYLAGRFIPATVSIAVIIIAVKFIGPSEYGIFSLIFSLVLIFITLSYHWIQVSIQRFLGAVPKDTDLVMGRFFDLTILSAVISTLITIAILFVYLHLSPVSLTAVALITFLTHFYLYHQAVFQAYRRSLRYALIEGTDQLIILTALFAGLFFFKIYTSSLLLIAMAVGLLGSLIFRIFLRIQGLHTIQLTKVYWDARFSGKVLEYGFGLTVWMLLYQVLFAADRFILYEYLGLSDAGAYSALKDLVFKGVTFSVLPVFISYQTRIADEWSARHGLATWAKVKEAISFELLIFVIIFLIFMGLKTTILSGFLGLPQLDEWTVYFPVLMAAFLWQMALLLQRFLDLSVKSSFVLYSMLAVVAVNVLMNILLVPILGVAAGSVSLLTSSALYVVLVFSRCLIACRTIN
jgi:O-antigen/teichoic acid export membrane protein